MLFDCKYIVWFEDLRKSVAASMFRAPMFLVLFTIAVVALPVSASSTSNGYLIEIGEVYSCDIHGNPKDGFAKETSAYFKINVKNNDVSPQEAKIVITVYDDGNVPLGIASSKITIAPSTSTYLILSLPIPRWTYVGTGKVRVGAYAPDDMYPYCPGVSAFFEIKVPGDCNGDGHVDPFDLGLIIYAWGSQPGDANWDDRCDFNSDGEVNSWDVAVLAMNW